jgi:hypothetical protein
VSKQLSRRARVVLPADEVADIDKLVGKRGRSAFLTEVARDEIQRRQQRDSLREAKGAWKDADHPELKDGAVAWVGRMRSESETAPRSSQAWRDRLTCLQGSMLGYAPRRASRATSRLAPGHWAA